MTRATYEIGREPAKPDPLRQIPITPDTMPDPETVVAIRMALADHIARQDLRDAERALWSVP